MSREYAAPDVMGELRRTHAAAEVTADLVDREVVLAGWVHRRRDHGGVIFVDLRDRGERVQVVFRPDASPEAHARAGELRSEYVILVTGVVMRRSADTVNPKLATGEVEVEVSELRLLNRATPPPFAIEEEVEARQLVRKTSGTNTEEAFVSQEMIKDLESEMLAAAEELPSEIHQLGNGFPVADKLEQLGGNQGDALWIVEAHPPGQAFLRQEARVVKHELLYFTWS